MMNYTANSVLYVFIYFHFHLLAYSEKKNIDTNEWMIKISSVLICDKLLYGCVQVERYVNYFNKRVTTNIPRRRRRRR